MDNINLEKVCRACLTEEGKMLNIFNVNISKKLMACANIQVWKDDGLPSHICSQCVAHLHVAFQLKKRAEKNDQKLRAYIDKLNKEKLSDSRLEPLQICKNQVVTDDNIRVELPVDTNVNDHLSEAMPCVFVGGNIVGGSLASLPVNQCLLNQNQLSYIQTGQNVQVISNYQPGLQTLSYPMEYTNSYHPLETHDDQILAVSMPPVKITTEDEIDIKEVKVGAKQAQEKQRRGCPTCKKVFRNQYKLNRHMKIHSTEKQYECKVCKKGFNHGGNFKIHMRMHTGEKPFECSVCGKAFFQMQDVTKHMRVHTGERPYKCPMCDKAFSTSSNLTAHKRTHTGEKPYVCPWCNKGFCQSNELKKHVRVHTGEKSHICDICHKGFNGSGPMLLHRRTHMGDRRYQCKICEQSYKTPNVLQVHIKTHKKCPPCKKEFKNINEIKMHYFTTHGIVFDKLPMFDKIVCHFCSSVFHNSTEFLGHLKTHLK